MQCKNHSHVHTCMLKTIVTSSFAPSVSGQVGVTDQIYLSAWKHPRTKWSTSHSSVQGTGRPCVKGRNPEKWEMDEAKPVTAQQTAMGRSRQGYRDRQRRPHPGNSLGKQSSADKTALWLWKAGSLEFAESSPREGRASLRSVEGPLENAAKNWVAHGCEETEAGQELSESEGRVPHPHIGPQWLSPQPDQKASQWMVTKVVLCQEYGIISLRLRLAVFQWNFLKAKPQKVKLFPS